MALHFQYVTHRALVVCVVLASFVAASYGQALLLHNTLGSASEISNSVVGPALTPATGGSVGTPAFVAGQDGGALQLGPPASGGSYSSGVGVPLYTIPTSLISVERGTIEVVFKVNFAPNPYTGYQFAQLFDGPYGQEPGIGLTVGDTEYDGTTRLAFYFQTGFPQAVATLSLADGLRGHAITGQLGTWFHVVAEWDRAGIGGTSDTMRLTVDGVLRAVASQSNWISSWAYPTAKFGGCTGNGQGAFAIDDLKLWSATISGPPAYALNLSTMSDGALVSLAYGVPSDLALTAFSFDPANAGTGLGGGWFAGLHIGLGDLMGQWSVVAPPFMMPLSDHGSAVWFLPPTVMSLFSGFTVYGVSLDVDPSTLVIRAQAPPVALTLP